MLVVELDRLTFDELLDRCTQILILHGADPEGTPKQQKDCRECGGPLPERRHGVGGPKRMYCDACRLERQRRSQHEYSQRKQKCVA